MAETKLAPLSTQVPIVDSKTGNPTPYFQQLMQIFIDEKNAAVDDLEENIEDLGDLVTVVANLELDDLTDVDTSTTPPDDGQALIWDDANSEWIPGDVASGSGSVPFGGAMVKKASDETAANYSAGVYVPWTAEEYDTHNIHDNSTNNSRLTVPTGVTRVRLAFNIEVAAATVTASDFFRAQIHKGGAFVIGCSYNMVEISNNPAIGISGSTGVITVNPGDYFQLWLDTESDTSITLDSTKCWFSMEIVESTLEATTNFRGAMVRKASDAAAANFTTATAITWDTDVYDTDNIHDTSSNTSRLTVPSGVTKVRLKAQVELNSLTSGNWTAIVIRKGGVAAYSGCPAAVYEIDASFAVMNISSGVLNVSAGEYFEVFVQVESDTTVGIVAQTSWFTMEVVEGTSTVSTNPPWQLIDQNGAATASPTWAWSTNVTGVNVINLSAYNELLIVARGITLSSSGQRTILASVNNGSSFYSASGDYYRTDSDGLETASTAILTHNTGTTAARNVIGHILNLKGAVNTGLSFAGESRIFVASTSDINAIRLTNNAGANMTAGTLYVYAR